MIRWKDVPVGTKLSVRKRDKANVTYFKGTFSEYDEENGLVFVICGKGINMAYRERDCRLLEDRDFKKYRISYEDFIAGKETRIEQIALEIAELVDRKNQDYDNSFENLFDEYGWSAFTIRLSDKLSRLKHLTQKGVDLQVKSESIDDTIRDIIGYSLLMLDITERRGK